MFDLLVDPNLSEERVVTEAASSKSLNASRRLIDIRVETSKAEIDTTDSPPFIRSKSNPKLEPALVNQTSSLPLLQPILANRSRLKVPYEKLMCDFKIADPAPVQSEPTVAVKPSAERL